MSGNQRDEQEGFLERWSRRKALSQKGEALPEPEDDATPQGGDVPEAGAAADEAPEEQGGEGATPDAVPELPPLETLSEDSDYSAFMGEGVPADLKQEALRKLFHSPKFNIRDGLDDYDWDLSKPEPLGDIVTAEMRYRIERELERLAGLDEDQEAPAETPALAEADAGDNDDADALPDPETDDDRSEPS